MSLATCVACAAIAVNLHKACTSIASRRSKERRLTMWTYVNMLLVITEIGFQVLLICIVMQIVLIAIVPPLWVATYYLIRPRLRMCRRLPTLVAWAQGILALGIVAASAPIQSKNAYIARLRFLLVLNALLIMLIGTLVRSDLQITPWLSTGLCCIVMGTRPLGKPTIAGGLFVQAKPMHRMDNARQNDARIAGSPVQGEPQNERTQL
jgi:hypothetical protein